jgi:hypothetical protein
MTQMIPKSDQSFTQRLTIAAISIRRGYGVIVGRRCDMKTNSIEKENERTVD